MKWEKKLDGALPIKSWAEEIEEEAMKQAANLATHPAVRMHVALMPDCHVGYGMPIGGVVACENALIPNAVGVDIGCGVCAVKTSIDSESVGENKFRKILDIIKRDVPLGEGHHRRVEIPWDGFDKHRKMAEKDGGLPYLDKRGWEAAVLGLGSLGGGNHFIEFDHEMGTGCLWLLLHSGSRNLGHRTATYYHDLARKSCEKKKIKIPSQDLAFLDAGSDEGRRYVRDMNFALEYAKENRRIMMEFMKKAVIQCIPETAFHQEINIHHNYAAYEDINGRFFWIHRKGATSARKGQKGVIPGSMGTASYIVEGLGKAESFFSCSHGAGRRMGRTKANQTLSLEECSEAMKAIIFEGWKKNSKKGSAGYDLSEAPQAYKDIEEIISSQSDLVVPLARLLPLAVMKG
ncbi:MAG TPA: RtcB family protein [Victivallales bacterium]|nr:RtcB family protein [Victivallales bacterium]